MGDLFKGDSKAQPVGPSTAEQLQALTTYLPGLMQITNAQAVPSAQADLAAKQATAPQEQALNAKLYAQNLPTYLNAQSAGELGNIQGSGGQSVLAAQELQKQIDPEYYSTRAAMASKLGDLMNNPISGGESAAIERANNAGQIGRGTFDVKNNSDTIQSAMNFGSAGRDRLAQALQLATNATPTMRSGTDTFAQATGRGGTMPGIGTNLTSGVNTQNGFNAGQSAANSIAQQQQQDIGINANRRSVTDYVNSAYSAAGSGTSGMASSCCFIFLESYNGVLPWYVRKSRDYYYQQDSKLSTGYIKMAKWLVPLMHKYTKIRNIVNFCMVKPLTKYGRWMWVRDIKYPHGCNLVRLFWFNVWKAFN